MMTCGLRSPNYQSLGQSHEFACSVQAEQSAGTCRTTANTEILDNLAQPSETDQAALRQSLDAHSTRSTRSTGNSLDLWVTAPPTVTPESPRNCKEGPAGSSSATGATNTALVTRGPADRTGSTTEIFEFDDLAASGGAGSGAESRVATLATGGSAGHDSSSGNAARCVRSPEGRASAPENAGDGSMEGARANGGAAQAPLQGSAASDAYNGMTNAHTGMTNAQLASRQSTLETLHEEGSEAAGTVPAQALMSSFYSPAPITSAHVTRAQLTSAQLTGAQRGDHAAAGAAGAGQVAAGNSSLSTSAHATAHSAANAAASTAGGQGDISPRDAAGNAPRQVAWAEEHEVFAPAPDPVGTDTDTAKPPPRSFDELRRTGKISIDENRPIAGAGHVAADSGGGRASILGCVGARLGGLFGMGGGTSDTLGIVTGSGMELTIEQQRQLDMQLAVELAALDDP